MRRVDARILLTHTEVVEVLPSLGPMIQYLITGIKVTNGHPQMPTKVRFYVGRALKMEDYCQRQGGGYIITLGGMDPVLLTKPDESISVQSSAAASVDVYIFGYAILV